jgi:hypothetical protein
MIRGVIFTLLSLSGLTACAAYTPDQVARPGDISLEQALTDVVTGFKAAQVAENDPRMGISVCSVTVNFNVAASAGQGGKLLLDATIKTPAPVNAGVSGSAEQDVTSNANRGNSITMVLTSPTCLPPNTSGAVMAAHVGNPTSAVKATAGGPAGAGATGHAASTDAASPGGPVFLPPDVWGCQFFPRHIQLYRAPC